MDAYIVKGRLENEGIPAYIIDSYFIDLDWTHSIALGGVKIHVPDAYRDQAIAVIDDIEAGDYSLTGELAKEEQTSCDKCDASNVHSIDFSWKFSLSIVMLAITLSLVIIPFPYTRRYYQCENCRHVFAVKKDYSTLISLLVSMLLFALTLLTFWVLIYIVTYVVQYVTTGRL